MEMIKLTCQHCGKALQTENRDHPTRVKCPHCKQLSPIDNSHAFRRPVPVRKHAAKKVILLAAFVLFILVTIAILEWVTQPTLFWPDRRPVGVVFLASHFSSSATNPRGWFNDSQMDIVGPDGFARFRKAILEYADRTITNLHRIGAQGVIVWDLEGEQFPHKTSYIGDPRQLDHLAPEMASVADEFFERFKRAGLRVGLTIRPQQLVFDDQDIPQQTQTFNIKDVLLKKIDYARARWGASIFYIDSNGGMRLPDEAWQFGRLARQRPGILLIPEHHDLLYQAFSAPYVSLRKEHSGTGVGISKKLFPNCFQALDISDASEQISVIAAARSRGDILLCRAWYWNSECQLLENFLMEDCNNKVPAVTQPPASLHL